MRRLDTGAVNAEPEGRPLLPVACTLGAADGAARLVEWRRVGDAAGRGVTRSPGALVLRYAADAATEEELARLVTAERECCGFATWTLRHDGADLVVEVRADDDALDALTLGA